MSFSTTVFQILDSLDADGMESICHEDCKTHSNNGPQKRLRHSAVVAE